jgi:endoglucanase
LFITSIGTGASLPTAQEIAKAMTIGWNLGNTLEAIGGETAWGNPVASRTLLIR